MTRKRHGKATGDWDVALTDRRDSDFDVLVARALVEFARQCPDLAARVDLDPAKHMQMQYLEPVRRPDGVHVLGVIVVTDQSGRPVAEGRIHRATSQATFRATRSAAAPPAGIAGRSRTRTCGRQGSTP